MQVCNAVLRDSVPLVAMSPPPPAVLASLRQKGRDARLHGAGSKDPVTSLLARFPEALGRRLVFFEPTSGELSFDEAWLLNMFDAVQNRDQDRYCFALRSRMSKANAAEMHFFVMKAIRALDVL